MSEHDTQAEALSYYEKALTFFSAGEFARSQQMMREYRQLIDYAKIRYIDNRGELPGSASVIIITRDRGADLLDCLDSLQNQEGQSFETIVVDNGSSSPVREAVSHKKILLVESPFPFTPSEGRNIGAFHARADLLIFLDDDALAESRFVQSAVSAFEEHPFLGIRGRILPKSPQADNSLAGLYDLGQYPLPAILDIEGNFAVPTKTYQAVQGMNPLLFGAEGIEFTARLLESRPEGDVYYWPGMTIRHDYASGENLLAKRKRQALTHEYFRTLHPAALKIKERYTRVFNWRRSTENRPFLKALPGKIRNVSRDMRLALKSEKKIDHQTIVPDNDRVSSNSDGKLTNKAESRQEIDDLLLRVHMLEMELEAVRKTLAVRMANLFREAKAAPLRQGILLPIRLFRLLRESFRKNG